MATRGLIGYLDTNGDLILTTTYCHYDSYPSNLGKGLENFYGDDTSARKIANVGYISFLDGETGEHENTSSNKERPTRTSLPGNFNDAMMEIAERIDGVGADYGYVWDNENEEWITIKNDGIRRMSEDLEMALAHLKDKFEMMPERPDQTMEEGMVTPDNRVEYLAHALDMVWKRGRGNNSIDFYSLAQSLVKDMFDSEETTPEIPGFEGTRDALDALEEGFVRKMKHRAGITK